LEKLFDATTKQRFPLKQQNRSHEKKEGKPTAEVNRKTLNKGHNNSCASERVRWREVKCQSGRATNKLIFI